MPIRTRRIAPKPAPAAKPAPPPSVCRVNFTASVVAFVRPDIVYFRDDRGTEHRVRLTPDGVKHWRARVGR